MKVAHYNDSAHYKSLVVYATSEGYIHGWDLRSKTEAWKAQLPVSFFFSCEPVSTFPFLYWVKKKVLEFALSCCTVLSLYCLFQIPTSDFRFFFLVTPVVFTWSLTNFCYGP